MYSRFISLYPLAFASHTDLPDFAGGVLCIWTNMFCKEAVSRNRLQSTILTKHRTTCNPTHYWYRSLQDSRHRILQCKQSWISLSSRSWRQRDRLQAFVGIIIAHVSSLFSCISFLWSCLCGRFPIFLCDFSSLELGGPLSRTYGSLPSR